LANVFPFDALGPILGSAAQAIAQDVQAPDSLAGGSVLAAAALAAQPLANVVLPHGQRSPLSLFVVTGAGSGDRKSAVDAVACHEIEETRKQQARAFANELAQHDADVAARKGTKEPEAPRPTPRSITTGNATIEGISKLLKHQASLGVFSAEGGEMLGGHSLRDERRSSGVAFYLKGWGGESLDSLRGGEGLTVLLGRRLSMHILVQPVLLRQLLRDPLAQGQGLLARCLIRWPAPACTGTSTLSKTQPCWPTTSASGCCWRRLQRTGLAVTATSSSHATWYSTGKQRHS
jgi:putative DNA primase/helicase